MKGYVFNWKCCLCRFLGRPRETRKTSFRIIEAVADIRTWHLSSTNWKHCRLSELANLRDAIFKQSVSHVLHASPSRSPSRDHPNYICKMIKICRSSLCKFFQCPIISQFSGTSILCKILFLNTVNDFFQKEKPVLQPFKHEIKLCFMHFHSFKF